MRSWVGFGLFILLVASIFTPTIAISAADEGASRAVFLIDHGTHTSLALETTNGEMVRYAYGDYRYYAERDTSLGSGAAALFLPTKATLGRARLSAPASESSLRAQLVVGVQEIYQLSAEAQLVDALIAKLDELHASQPSVEVPAYGLSFAPHPDDYFWFRNSSSVVAGWLRELDVRVLGWGLWASWWVYQR